MCILICFKLCLKLFIIIRASVVYIGHRYKIGHSFMIPCKSIVVPMQYSLKIMSMTFISHKLETAMTSQGHVTTASLK